MYITQAILSKTNLFRVYPEITPNNRGFSMFNDAGTELEVSEFLYTLVRLLKPQLILETGTHKGVSAIFMGQALHDNGQGGQVLTFEIIPEHYNTSCGLFKEVGLTPYIVSHLQDAATYDSVDQEFDLLFLDSEPNLRFDEFIKFWPNLRPGGFIVIHDLHPYLGHTGLTNHGVLDWPYGDFREKLGPYILEHEVQTISFPTPRGLTLFQKYDTQLGANNLLKGKL